MDRSLRPTRTLRDAIVAGSLVAVMVLCAVLVIVTTPELLVLSA